MSVFRHLAVLLFAAFLALGPVQPTRGQEACLKIVVLDPSGAVVPNAAVSIGPQEQRTYRTGATSFCGLGAGPHSVVVLAPGLAPAERTVDSSQGTVTITTEIEAFSDQLVVVGTRAEGRTVLEATVPVDLVRGEEFIEQGTSDLADQLRNSVPSFNVNVQPISDSSTVVRPAGLRNLAPDHTLVLVNGKRRHRAAVIHWFSSGVFDGSQGPDLSTIPSIAVHHAEVLRDGASAQYGSDAIAGVLNFALKDADSGGALQLRTGAFGVGDGESVTFAGNVGLPLGDGGFANLSVEYGNTGPTSRSVQRHDAQQLIAHGNTAVRSPAVQIWGIPEVQDDIKLWGNFGKFLRGTLQAYGHANYASRRVEGGFYYRHPLTRGGVFTGDGGKTLLVGDVLDAADGIPDGSANCPTVRLDGPRIADQTAYDAVLSDPNCFTFHEPFAGKASGFPGGFTPQFGGQVHDWSLVGGLRGALAGGWFWDASIGFGINEMEPFIYDTVNASLGPESPTRFNPGKTMQEETNFNVDFSRAFRDNLHFAGGVEIRNEQFAIFGGDRPSWEAGPYAPQGFVSASNGFNGFSPITVGSWDRRNYAVYGDLELGGSDSRYTLGGALRGERFDDFGSTINYKLAGRFELGGGISVRGGASSGFRAPTPGQQNAYNVTAGIFVPDTGEYISTGSIAPTSEVAAAVGGEPLKPETSRNYTAGLVADKGPFSLSVDYFRINLQDRIWFSGDYQLTQTQISQLVNEGITGAAGLGTFRFFTNDFDTASNGVDVVATWTTEALGDSTVVSFLLNRTTTSVERYNTETAGPDRIHLLENALPELRTNLTVRHRTGRFRLLARLSYWDDFFDRLDLRNYSGKHLVDLEVTYELTQQFSVSLGGQNVLNAFPDMNPDAHRFLGNKYPESTPFGFNGGYYYMRLTYNWGRSY